MNHATFLHNTLSLEYPGTTEGDYGTHRQFPGASGFGPDEDGSRRVGALGNPLVQPVSIPGTNGVRYSAQQPALQDVAYSASPSLLMNSPDSCSVAEAFSPAAGSVYSHSGGFPYDSNMSDFRSHRVPALQPPAGLSPSLQSQSAVSAASALMGRGDTYAYTLNRSPFPSLSTSLNDMSRYSQYTSTPRLAVESSLDRSSQNILFGHNGTMMMEPVQRAPSNLTDAPPFHETSILQSIITGNQTIKPEIQAKIHKGFFQVDEKWTCYRRNYFSVSCSFSLRPWAPSSSLYLRFSDNTTERIGAFGMSISAIVNEQYGEIRDLVQHTPKRDKQSERRPGRITLQPSQPQPLLLGHASTSNGNTFGFGMGHSSGIPLEYGPYTNTSQASQPPTQHTFERIQFQKATANNGKRRAQQQYYNLVVELWAELADSVNEDGETEWVKIARRLSDPMVVRGRSPGHYKDGRRDSTTSMGPDGGNGAAGDGAGPVLPPGIGHPPRSHPSLMAYDPSHRGGAHQYTRPDYRHMPGTDHSPLTESPLISSSSSSGLDFAILNDSMDPMDTIKSVSSIDSLPDSTFSLPSPDPRKLDLQSQYRAPPCAYGYDSPKNSDEPSSSFPESYDPMISILHSEPDESAPYLRQLPRLGASQSHPPSTNNFDPFFSSRLADGRSYNRFESIQSSPSLCT
ncbi:hypothetical protein ASPZODRAFT_16376 [Penicilliopsis zonata CBS 506.65]|uniref:NDT80 domain-containing protein n=1 Tax=Penicilliopsis zonata CBS 506.65 TaxID=1073090 RepID=A0A1L9SHD7_9EURO|nr:hypothetical protein ASPZODRAFT_16376 [Penicilliopsis zonata CBS 506.65]OJJ46619.1 hypothetical protein ASPZODRAFT_16376 [Penicilliopsis zonata CBS 506.65]